MLLNNEAQLLFWREEQLKEYGHLLIHCVQYDHGELFNNAADVVMRQWDVISCSLFDPGAIRVFNSVRACASGNFRETGLFGTLGLVLSVPPQNILGTFPRDAMLPNHAGIDPDSRRLIDRYALADSTVCGQEKFAVDREGGCKQLMAPHQLLKASRDTRYNEVQVIGRPGVRLYKTFPATAPITVKEILIVPKMPTDTREPFALKHRYQRHSNALALQKLNPHLPIRTIG